MPNYIFRILLKDLKDRTFSDSMNLLYYWSSPLSSKEIRYALLVSALFAK